MEKAGGGIGVRSVESFIINVKNIKIMQYEPQQDFDDTDALGKGFPLGDPLGEPSRLSKWITFIIGSLGVYQLIQIFCLLVLKIVQ